jgi:Cupin superfamily protein
VRGASPVFKSPLDTWVRGPGTAARVRARLGRAPLVLAARDDAWRSTLPPFEDVVTMAASGLPFQIVSDRRYDRMGDRRRVRPALAEGGTLLLTQPHQVLPRLMRLIVGLRVAFMGPFREECSYLFATEGRGREAMGLHHDGDVEQFWLQVEGRRTVTLGRPVDEDTPEDLPGSVLRRGRWETLRLEPGSLLYLPPRTPHRVVCHERSLAVSLTWNRLDIPAALDALLDRAGLHVAPARATSPAALAAAMRSTVRRAARALGRPLDLGRARAASLSAWDVVAGRADAIPPERSDRLWAQVPVVAGPARSMRRSPCWVAGGIELWLPAGAARLAGFLSAMPVVLVPGRPSKDVEVLLASGILANRDLPLRIVPADPTTLDGWHFA